MFCIADSREEEFWGPYTDKTLAERILKIVRLGTDPGAELVSKETDQYANEILSGLLPWNVQITTDRGEVIETVCNLTWPPEVAEGIIRGEELGPEVEQVEYFFWSKTALEAKLKLARLGSSSTKAEAI